MSLGRDCESPGTTNGKCYQGPGGYLQWDGYDLESRLINHLQVDETGIRRAIGGHLLPWTAKSADVFAEMGLQGIEVDERPSQPNFFQKFGMNRRCHSVACFCILF